MWNKIAPALGSAAGAARPMPAPAPAPSAPMLQPVAAAAPPQAAPQHQPGQLPPEFQQHVDPNNPMQATLIQRGHQLQPQESQAFAAGIDVPALNVLKKLVPELGFLWDKIIQQKSGAGGPPVVPGQPAGAPPAQSPVPPPQRLGAQRFQP